MRGTLVGFARGGIGKPSHSEFLSCSCFQSMTVEQGGEAAFITIVLAEPMLAPPTPRPAGGALAGAHPGSAPTSRAKRRPQPPCEQLDIDRHPEPSCP
jgi:hypothetical protein